MFHRFTQSISGRRFGARTIASIALSSLFVGLLVASSLQWTNVSVAQGYGQNAARAAGTPAMPGSVAELVERLGPDGGQYSGDQGCPSCGCSLDAGA